MALNLSKQQILHDSQLEEFANDNFNIDENGRKFSEQVENAMGNTVGKGEIARYEQFLLFPQSFQKTCIADTYNPGFVWERADLHSIFDRNVSKRIQKLL